MDSWLIKIRKKERFHRKLFLFFYKTITNLLKSSFLRKNVTIFAFFCYNYIEGKNRPFYTEEVVTLGTYNLPRDVKGEGRILFIFSTKALIYTAIGGGIGVLIYFILNLIGLGVIGIIVIGILGLIGFSIGTFKMPDTNAFQITKKTGGENIDDVIKRAIKFKMQKNKIYIYQKEETKENEEETKDE